MTEQPFYGNPLARPIMRLLEAIEDEPQHREVYVYALQEHARHAYQLLQANREGRLAPILAMCAIRGFNQRDYQDLILAIASSQNINLKTMWPME